MEDKNYVCPKCSKGSSVDEWDEKTFSHAKEQQGLKEEDWDIMISIEDEKRETYHVCPVCGEVMEFSIEGNFVEREF